MVRGGTCQQMGRESMYHRPRIIPTLLLDEGMMVKTIRFQNPRYLGDVVNAVRIFNNKGVDELCILDISATRNASAPDMELLHDIATEAFMPLSYGGGVCSIDQVKRLFRSGYEKVIFNTALVNNPGLVKQAVSFAGAQSVVASIDVKTDIFGRESCYIEDGQTKVGKTAVQMARHAERLGVGEILLTSMNRDGEMKGYDLKLVVSVAESVGIPVIANGGAGGINDIKRVLEEGRADAAAAGSMFVYYGRNKAVLITAPDEDELVRAGVYCT